MLDLRTIFFIPFLGGVLTLRCSNRRKMNLKHYPLKLLVLFVQQLEGSKPEHTPNQIWLTFALQIT